MEDAGDAIHTRMFSCYAGWKLSVTKHLRGCGRLSWGAEAPQMHMGVSTEPQLHLPGLLGSVLGGGLWGPGCYQAASRVPGRPCPPDMAALQNPSSPPRAASSGAWRGRPPPPDSQASPMLTQWVGVLAGGGQSGWGSRAGCSCCFSPPSSTHL